MAKKNDDGKLLWHLLPTEALEEIIKVLQYGAEKYSEDNWRTRPYLTRNRIVNASKRHQAAIDKGELYDEETGLLHSAHKACADLFQLYYDIHGMFNVDLTQ